MCALQPKLKFTIFFIFFHIDFIFIIFFHWHNSFQKQNLGIKSSQACQVKKWSCLRVTVILTSFSNSNSSNGAVLLFVQTPFDAAKQSVLRLALTSFVGVGQRFVEYIHVAVFAIFPTSFSNRNCLSQSASSYPGRCHSIYKKPYNIAHLGFVYWHTQVCFPSSLMY